MRDPTKVDHEFQGASTGTPQLCHESLRPHAHELSKTHMQPLPPSGRKDVEETQDKA